MNKAKPIIQLNEESIKSELKELVRNSVDETLNELLTKEAEELTSAAKYERTGARQGYRSGHDSRKLITTSGEVRLEVPKLKGVSFETAIIERYRRRESSVEEALIEIVSCRCFGASCRRHLGSPVGQPCIGIHHQRSESESLHRRILIYRQITR